MVQMEKKGRKHIFTNSGTTEKGIKVRFMYWKPALQFVKETTQYTEERPTAQICLL